MQVPRPVRQLPVEDLLESHTRLQSGCIHHQTAIQKGMQTVFQNTFLNYKVLMKIRFHLK